MGGSADEFPLLSALGLYAADIRGDGECMCSIFDSMSCFEKITFKILSIFISWSDAHTFFQATVSSTPSPTNSMATKTNTLLSALV